VSAPVGEEVPGQLLGHVVRVGLGGAFAGVVDFLLGAFLLSNSLVLAADASSLTTCLAAVTPKLS
jgi:hypothetical protein